MQLCRLEKLGIGVDQVSVERIAFPEENLEAVFERMRIERQAEANRLRAEGAKEAQAIRDKTHVETQEILRKGREEAARITAEAERRAAELLAKAHQKNPEFYQFWSSLQASKRVLKEKATLILSSDQLFFGGLESGAAETMTTQPGDAQTRSNAKANADGFVRDEIGGPVSMKSQELTSSHERLRTESQRVAMRQPRLKPA